MVRLSLFGQAEVRSGDLRVSFRSAKALELLAYLATSTQAQATRAELASALWPDAEPHRQRPNLRQTIQYIRQAEVTAHIKLVHVEDDVILLDAKVVSDIGGASDKSFLPTFEGEWVEARRAEFDRRRLLSLIQAGQDLLESAPSHALEQAEKAIGMDPFLESARSLKIAALKRLNENAKAAQAAEEYAQLVRREFGLEPSTSLVKSSIDRSPARSDNGDARLLSPRERLLLLVASVPADIAQGTLEEAAARLEQALGEIQGAPQAERQGLIALARLAIEAGDAKKAAQLMERVNANGAEGLPAEALVTYARALFLGGNRQRAAAYAQRAIAAAKKAGEVEPLIDSMLIGVQISWGNDDLEAMLRLSDRALKLCEKAGSRRRTWRALDARAAALFRLNRLAEAEEAHRRCVAEANAWGRSDMEAYSRSKLGRLLEAEGKLEAARAEHLAALEILQGGQQLGWLGQTLTYLGDLETLMGNPEEGQRYHAWGVGLRRMSGESLGLATSLRGLGKAMLARGNYDGSIEALRESVRIFLQMEDRASAASSRVPLAQALKLVGQRQQAVRMLDLADEALSGLTDDQILIYFNDRALLAENRRALRA